MSLPSPTGHLTAGFANLRRGGRLADRRGGPLAPALVEPVSPRRRGGLTRTHKARAAASVSRLLGRRECDSRSPRSSTRDTSAVRRRSAVASASGTSPRNLTVRCNCSGPIQRTSGHTCFKLICVALSDFRTASDSSIATKSLIWLFEFRISNFELVSNQISASLRTDPRGPRSLRH